MAAYIARVRTETGDKHCYTVINKINDWKDLGEEARIV